MQIQKTTKERESKYFYLFLAYIFILPLWPNYAELKFGGLPNIAPDRILRFALFFGFIGIFFTNSEAVQMMKRRVAKHWVLVFALSLFYTARIASAWVSPNTAFQLYAFFRNEFLISFPFFFYALLAIRDSDSVKKIMVTLVVSGFIASLIALLDYYKQKNLFMGLVPISSDYLMGVFLDKTRDDGYRAQGTFEHPILLGQFFILILPVIWTLLRDCKSIYFKALFGTAGLFALASVFASGSRAALGLAIAVVSLFALWEIYLWTHISKNRVLQYLVISQAPIPILGAIYALYSYKSTVLGQTQETLSSTNARIDMLLGGGPKILDSPIWGHGLGEALSVFSLVGRAGIRTLDNYYILIGLETGALALALFMLIFIISIFNSIRKSTAIFDIHARLYFAVALMLLTYTIQMAVHSLPQQIWMAFLALSIIIINQESNFLGSSSNRQNSKVRNAISKIDIKTSRHP